jgi:hypothetical protein
MAVRDNFISGEILLAADLNDTFAAKANLATVGLSDTSASAYTLQLSDAGKLVTVSASVGAVNVTIPAETSASFADGSLVGVTWLGAASAVTIVAASGVTLNSTVGSASPVPLSGRYAAAQVYKTGTNTWIAVGSLA